MWPFKSRPDSAPPAPAAAETRALNLDLLTLFGGSPSASGITVSPSTALSVPAVRAPVELLSGVLGSLPVKVFAPVAAGGKEALADHPADGVGNFGHSIRDGTGGGGVWSGTDSALSHALERMPTISGEKTVPPTSKMWAPIRSGRSESAPLASAQRMSG